MQLSEWLKREGIARKDFAARIAVSPSYITALCDGTVWPGRDVVTRIIDQTNGDVTSGDFLVRPESSTAGPEAAA